MHGTIDGFSYGMVTPLVGYVMACLGNTLGLRCTVRSLGTERARKPGWLALGAASIGCGIWTMHFIAMLGFQVRETPISYDAPLTFLSLFVAVVVVGVGVFIVGYLGTRPACSSRACFTGLGVAGMHYLGMAAMRMNGQIAYAPAVVVVSVVIAVVAATAAPGQPFPSAASSPLRRECRHGRRRDRHALRGDGRGQRGGLAAWAPRSAAPRS
ncbi:putative signaling protein [Streptomyces narbonensis]